MPQEHSIKNIARGEIQELNTTCGALIRRWSGFGKRDTRREGECFTVLSHRQ
jgi:hypothetical protein